MRCRLEPGSAIKPLFLFGWEIAPQSTCRVAVHGCSVWLQCMAAVHTTPSVCVRCLFQAGDAPSFFTTPNHPRSRHLQMVAFLLIFTLAAIFQYGFNSIQVFNPSNSFHETQPHPQLQPQPRLRSQHRRQARLHPSTHPPFSRCFQMLSVVTKLSNGMHFLSMTGTAVFLLRWAWSSAGGLRRVEMQRVMLLVAVSC